MHDLNTTHALWSYPFDMLFSDIDKKMIRVGQSTLINIIDDVLIYSTKADMTGSVW